MLTPLPDFLRFWPLFLVAILLPPFLAVFPPTHDWFFARWAEVSVGVWQTGDNLVKVTLVVLWHWFTSLF